MLYSDSFTDFCSKVKATFLKLNISDQKTGLKTNLISDSLYFKLPDERKLS